MISERKNECNTKENKAGVSRIAVNPGDRVDKKEEYLTLSLMVVT